jgi:hypothetical protein
MFSAITNITFAYPQPVYRLPQGYAYHKLGTNALMH